MNKVINIALPKGRLGEKVYKLFEKLGYGCPALLENTRKLVFEDEKNGVRYFWVKPSDVAIYVETGVADVGVVGKDILLEQNPDVYELLDLGFGKCRMAVAGKKGEILPLDKTIKVATKFPNIAKKHFTSKSREIDIIKLNGSIELAPILGMSDVIVDIVETGSTLRENDLEVFEDIVNISARFISNKTSFRFKTEEIELMKSRIEKELYND
ncbi:MAG: ATP phosphoribosyltransferase [Clostridia bacterium]|nr:ATP phosphoribosyltransferase [Clostridia bacterium]